MGINNSRSFSLEEKNDSYDLYEYNIPSMDIEEEDNIFSIILDNFKNNIEKEAESLNFSGDEIYFNNLGEKSTTKEEKNDNNKKEESNKANHIIVKSCGGGIISKKTAKDKIKKEERRIELEKTASSTEKTESKTDQSNEKNKMTEEKNLNNNIINNKENKQEIINKDEIDFIMNGFTNINLEVEYLLNNINNNNDEKKILGKKRKKKLLCGDNLIKNTRITLLQYIFDFINEKIRILLNNDIGKSICLKQFVKITKIDLYHSNVEYDKNFLNKKLKDILSFKISGKYSNYLEEHNINLVQYLISHEKIGNYFQSLFDLSFLNCLDYINGKKNYDLLNGLAKVDEIIEKEEKDLDDYEKIFYKDFIKDYDNIIKNKNSRNQKNKS